MEYFEELTSLFESEDADLFKPKPKRHIATADDHLIESFNKITLFVRRFGRMPDAEAEDMNEAVLGTQLNAIRSDKIKWEALQDFDELGLLELQKAPETLDELFSEDAGLFGDDKGIFDITKLPKGRRVVEHGDDAAQREPIDDFEHTYKHLFIEQQKLLESGVRKLSPFYSINQLQLGNYYVYDGMMCFVSEFGEVEQKAGGYTQQRILVIFENGTKSNMYKRSLAQRLYEGGTIVVDARYVATHDDGAAVGHIYILESLSEDPKINTIKDLYKIGYTNTSIQKRVKNASNDPTYLMAPVQIVEEYRLTGDYSPQKVEDLIHGIFGAAKVDLQIIDKNRKIYIPSEWYSVPLPSILEAIDMISTGEIIHYHYDSVKQELVSNLGKGQK